MSLSRDEWDKLFLSEYNRYWFETKSHQRSFDLTQQKMLRDFGPRPEVLQGLEELKSPSLLAVAKLGLKVRKGLSMQKPSVAAVAAAIAAAASAFGAAFALANADSVISSSEWVGVIWAAASALIAGLFTSPSVKPPQV